MDNSEVKKTVKESYAKIATSSESCCDCDCRCPIPAEKISKEIGYSDKDLEVAPEANMGLGCGNPTALGEIKEGDVVLDLGSGAGIDCFLASKKVGDAGKVIGVDMTQEMLDKAGSIAEKHCFKNVEFRKGDIEELPVDSASVDVVISNCVINLAPDKQKVFNDVFRVLKPGGRMYISDIVLLEELDEGQKNDKNLLSGCVAGALLKDEYISLIENAGFSVKILSEDKGISKRQYQGIALESLKIEARKT